MRLNHILSAVSVLCAIACGGQAEDAHHQDPVVAPPHDPLNVAVEPTSAVAKVWFEEHPVLQSWMVHGSCENWDGFSCQETSIEEAAIRFVIDESPCLDTEEEQHPIGFAERTSELPYDTLIVYPACLTRDGIWTSESTVTDTQLDYLVLVMAHELGHLLGVPHIALCDGDVHGARLFSDEQGVICGLAVMNRALDGRVGGVNDLDRRAFRLRLPNRHWPKTDAGPWPQRDN